jgi:prophage maintenance system killer protein
VVDYLGLGDLLALHAEVMARLGRQPTPLRDEDGLQAELLRPQAAAHYERADLVRQAAILGVGVAQLQPFEAGSHPTAYAAMETFLLLNGLALSGDPVRLATYLRLIAGEHDRATATDLLDAQLRREVRQR